MKLGPLPFAVVALASLSPASAPAAPHWSAPVDVIPGGGPTGTTSAPRAFVSPNGKSLVVAGSGNEALLASGSVAGVFASATPVATAPAGSSIGLDSAIGADGAVAVAWTSGGAGHVTVVKPGGDVLTQADLPGAGVNAIGVGVVDDGSVVVAYRTKESASSYSLRVATLPAGSATFGAPVVVESPAAVDFIDVATGPGGAVALAYRQLAGAPGKYRARVAVKPAGAAGFEPGQALGAASDQDDFAPQVAFDRDGTVVAAWGNPAGALYALRAPGASVPFGAALPLGSGPAYDVNMEPTPDGGAAVAIAGGGAYRAALQSAPGGTFSAPVQVGPSFTSQFGGIAAVTTTPGGTVTVLGANPTDGAVHAVDAGGADTIVGYGKRDGITPVSIASSADRTVAAWSTASGTVVAATRSESAKPASPGDLGPKPSGLDTRAPRLRLVGAPKRLRVTSRTKTITLKARCDEACKLFVTGNLRTRLSSKTRQRVAPLPALQTKTPRTGVQKLTLKLGSFALKDLRSALRRGKGAQLFLVIQASDAASNAARTRVQITLKPTPKKHAR
ncbi:MAG: hypothetical protein JWR63_156 [Conexibacter sp.]|nr:hypothetical protein [Conexibacter sp.]